jgi:hypothetical protein
MNSYERFMTALLRQGEPDRVPLWELTVNEPTLSAIGAKCLEDLAEMDYRDGITIFEDMRMQLLGSAQPSEVVWRGHTIVEGTRQVIRDEWGIIWGVTEFGIPYPIEGPIRSREDLKHYTPPDPDAPHRLRSLREAVQRFKGRKAIVFLTNVDCSIVLTRGNREAVEEAVKETIAKASTGGGHILSSSNSIHPGVKPENYLAMIAAARQYGNYPIDPKLVAEYRRKSYIRQHVIGYNMEK